MVRYIIQKARIKKGVVSLYGDVCLSIGGVGQTECGKEIDDKWYILEHGTSELEEKATCQKCKDIILKQKAEV